MGYKRGFKGKRRMNDPNYKPYDPLFHPKNIVSLMSQGLFDCEIEDEWYVSHATFHRWRQEHPELQDAYEVGLSKRKSYLVKNQLRPMMEGKLEGKHSFNAAKYVMDAELNYSPTVKEQGNTTNITIGNMAVLNQKTVPELIEKLNADFAFLEQHNVIQAEFKALEHDPSQSNEQDS